MYLKSIPTENLWRRFVIVFETLKTLKIIVVYLKSIPPENLWRRFVIVFETLNPKP